MSLRPFVAASFILVFGVATASGDSWQRMGPLAGAVYNVAIHPTNPQIIYFLTETTGLYRTLDGGVTSSAVPVPSSRVIFDPTDPNVLYAYEGHVYKSTDGGTNWSERTTFPAWSLAIDPGNPNRLFAGYYLPTGVYATSNGGATWAPLASFGTWSVVSALAVDPANGSTIYAGTSGDFDFAGEGLFKTTNGGATWTNVSPGFLHGNVSSLAIDPSNPAVIYAAVSGGGFYSGQGVIKSVDAGATWVQSGFPNMTATAVAVDPIQPSRVYAIVDGGLYVSSDGGGQWTPVDTPCPGGIADISLFRSDPNVLCVASQIGVLVSNNAGGDFVQWGFKPADMTAVLVDRTDANVIYATGRGRYKSTDGAVHWQPAGLTAFGQAIIQDPVDTGVLYNGAYTEGGVEKSVDSGATWTTSLAGKSINDVALAPSDHNVVYAGGLDRAYVGAIYKSVNAGSSWTNLPNLTSFFTDALAIDPTDEAIVYAGGQTDLIKSVDGGVTWSQVHNGLDQPASGWVLAVVIDPIHPETVYCGTSKEGVFKSIDGGAHWTRLTNFMTDVRAIAIDPEDTHIVYALWYYGGAYVSADGGTHWYPLGNSVISGTDVTIDPNNRDILYSAGGGLWRYLRTSQSAVPVIESHQPEAVVLSQCESGCVLSFSIGTSDDYAQAAVVALERKSGAQWVQEDETSAPLPSPSWQLTRTFHKTDAPGDYVFRAVIRGIDGARAVSNEVTVSVTSGPVATFFSRVDAVYSDGAAWIRWSTESSTPDLQGFDVYRRDGNQAAFRKLNEHLIVTDAAHEYNDTRVNPGARYTYQVAAVHPDGEWVSQTASLTIPAIAFELEQNRPNPFNPSTSIAFHLPVAGRAQLAVYNVNGELIAVLFDRLVAAGKTEIAWNGRDFAGAPVGSGVYFYRLTSSDQTLTRRMVLLK